MIMRHALIPIVICLLVPSAAWGVFDPNADLPDGMGNTVMLAESSALELLSVPVGGIMAGELKVESGYSRKFAMKELDRVYGVAARRLGRWTVALGFSQFGRSELYSEKVGRLALGCRIDSAAIGVTLSAMQLEFGGSYENLTAVTAGAGCGYNTNRLKAALMVENLTTPQLSDGSPEINVVSTLHMELIGPGPYSVTGRLTLEKTEKPQFGLGQKIRLSQRGSFFWGVTSVPVVYGGGVELNYKSYLITIAASYHPRLGVSHTVALALVRGGSTN